MSEPVNHQTFEPGQEVTIVTTGETAHVVEVIENWIYPEHAFYVLDINDEHDTPIVYTNDGLK